MTYDPDSVRVEAIREDTRYGGLRARVAGRLGTARCPVQMDVGFGDAVTPGAEDAEYPTLLHDVPAPRIKVYPRATVVAEKLEAIVDLGLANSRMKDYYDLQALARERNIDMDTLSEAIANTFARRGTPLPKALPVGLTHEFSDEASRLALWSSFLRKQRLIGTTLEQAIKDICSLVRDPLSEARARRDTP